MVKKARGACHGDQADHRNGYSKNTVLTDVVKIEIAVPRDRAAIFDPRLIAK
jgi:transposase-like protein